MGLLSKLKGYAGYLSEMANVNHYEWHIAIRKRSGKTLYQGNGDGFVSVPNSWRYWQADPFLFRHKGKDYLFAELYDRWKDKGVLGVCRIRNGKCGRFRVCLELEWHLSYPCVFEDEAGIHMVPECGHSGELWMYRCKKFPLKWEKERCLSKAAVADATPFFGKDGRLWFATVFSEGKPWRNDNLAVCTDLGTESAFSAVETDDTQARPAGHFIREQDGWLRPCQNCGDTYGGNLVFRRVEELGPAVFREHPCLSVYPPDVPMEDGIRVSCAPVIGTGYAGLHTYNANEDYEVIDLKYKGARSGISFIKNFRVRYLSRRGEAG